MRRWCVPAFTALTFVLHGPAPPAGASTFGYTISSSLTDPYQTSGPAPTVGVPFFLYVHLVCDDGAGITGFAFRVRFDNPGWTILSGTLAPALAGWVDLSGNLDDFAAAGPCLAGPTAVAEFLLLPSLVQTAGSACLEPSTLSGTNESFDCGGFSFVNAWTGYAAGSATACGYPDVCNAALAIERDVIGAGATNATDGTLALRGTVAESVIGPVAGGSNALAQGFWRTFSGAIVVGVPEEGGAPGPTIRYVNGLAQSFPNPFRDATSISFTLAEPTRVNLSVYDVAGRRVATLVDGTRLAGPQTVRWDGRNGGGTPVASGVYFYRLELGGWSGTKRMLKLR